MATPKLNIALLGTRGIPARYGGFETFAEELSTRLVARGHSVTVYARHRLGTRGPKPSRYRGVVVRSTATIMHKYLETPLHALSSFIDLCFRPYDVALLCNAANAPFAWILRLRRAPLLINVDGIERRRSKWNSLGRLWYRLGERCSVLFATRVIADARVIAEYYQQCFNIKTEVLAYGATAVQREPGEVLRRFGLSPGNYILYVSRLEPENNAKGVIEAYCASGVHVPLVIVGDAPYAEAYKQELRRSASAGVVFTGFQFGEAYQELRSHCLLYVQATEVGGTHPALVEAMAYGNCVIANHTPEHVEVLADTGRYYPFNDFSALSELLRELSNDRFQAQRLGAEARRRAEELFTWEHIASEYERLLISVLADADNKSE